MPGHGVPGLGQQIPAHFSSGVALLSGICQVVEPCAKASGAQQQDTLESAVKALEQQDARLLKAVEAIQEQQQVLLKELKACRQQREQILKELKANRTQAQKQQAADQQQQAKAGAGGSKHQQQTNRQGQAKQQSSVQQPVAGKQQACRQQQSSAGQQGINKQQNQNRPFQFLQCVRQQITSRQGVNVSIRGDTPRPRPIVTISLHTTGLDSSQDRVIEFTALKMMPDGQVWRVGPQRMYAPDRRISKKAYEMHGIWEDELVGMPTFSQCAPELYSFMFGDGSDIMLTSYNWERFVRPLLRAKFGRAGVYFPADMGFYDPMTVAAKDLNSTPRLQTAYVTYCGEELPHWASSHDKARAIHEVMLEQLRSDVTWRQ